MTAAKVLDVFSRLSDCVGEASDAVSVCTQVKLEGRSRFIEIAKVRMSQLFGHVYRVLDVQNHGIKYTILVVPIERHSHGHPSAGSPWERQFGQF